MISGEWNPFWFQAFAYELQSEPYIWFIRGTPSSLARVFSLAAAHGHFSLFVANQGRAAWCNKLLSSLGGWW